MLLHFVWFHQHSHSVLYNSRKYENFISTISECADGVHEKRKINIRAGRGQKIRHWDLRVEESRLELLYHVANTDGQSLLFFAR